MTRDIPDDMIDAEPEGAWAGQGTVSHDDDAAGDAQGVADAVQAYQEEAPDVETSTTDAAPAPDGDRASDPFVESAEIQQGEDPDLLTDDQARR